MAFKIQNDITDNNGTTQSEGVLKTLAEKKYLERHGDYAINNPLVKKTGTQSYFNDYAFISYGGSNLSGKNNQKNIFRGENSVTNTSDGLLVGYEKWSIPTTKNIIEWSKEIESQFTKAKGIDEISGDNTNKGSVTNRKDVYNVTGATAEINESYDLMKNNFNGIGFFKYDWKDFSFVKDYGRFPNNRLITLRRFKLPVLDSGIIASKKRMMEALKRDDEYISSDSARALTYFGEGTGNDINSILSFSVGLNWGEITSAEPEKLGMRGGGNTRKPGEFIDATDVIGNIPGFGKDTLKNKIISALGQATNSQQFYKEYGIESGDYLDTYQRYLALDGDADPWSNQWKNRVYGPINVITKTTVRQRGLNFSQNGLKITFKFDTMQIDSLNPKIAMLDILANMLALTYNNGAFWGGDYRFVSELPNFPLNTALSDIIFKMGAGDTNNIQPQDLINALQGQLQDVKNVANDNINTAESMVKAFQGLNNAGELGTAMTEYFKSEGEAVTSSLDPKNKTSSKTGSATDVSKVAAENANKAKRKLADTFMKFLQNNKSVLSDPQYKDQFNKIKTLTTVLFGQGSQDDIKNNVLKLQPLLTGEPVGEWHLVIGNPMNPTAMIGNLVCKSADFRFGKTLGPDDFPTELEVTVNLEHGRPRDKGDVESIFNLGQGRFYIVVNKEGVASDDPWNTGASTKNSENDNGGITKSREQFEASERGKKVDVKNTISDQKTVNNIGVNTGGVSNTSENDYDTNVDTKGSFSGFGDPFGNNGVF